jgi:hypothetical protein
MRSFVALALTAQMLTGCGSTPVHQGGINFAIAEPGSLTVGAPKVLSAKVNPMQPVAVRVEGNAIAVTFARRGQAGSVLSVDADSLSTRSSTDYTYAGKITSPAMDAQRVALADGGSIVVWTEGSAEWGHRAMAQSFGAGGAPRGAPVAVSPDGMDVFGTPRAATIDGRHVVATLPASDGKAFELVAIPIEVR